MSKGKYSPTVYNRKSNDATFEFNCFGQPVVEYVGEYNEQTMFGNYDSEGYDSYGYSAFDADKNYVGPGNGVDRNGYTEDQYMCMSDDEFESMY